MKHTQSVHSESSLRGRREMLRIMKNEHNDIIHAIHDEIIVEPPDSEVQEKKDWSRKPTS